MSLTFILDRRSLKFKLWMCSSWSSAMLLLAYKSLWEKLSKWRKKNNFERKLIDRFLHFIIVFYTLSSLENSISANNLIDSLGIETHSSRQKRKKIRMKHQNRTAIQCNAMWLIKCMHNRAESEMYAARARWLQLLFLWWSQLRWTRAWHNCICALIISKEKHATLNAIRKQHVLICECFLLSKALESILRIASKVRKEPHFNWVDECTE